MANKKPAKPGPSLKSMDNKINKRVIKKINKGGGIPDIFPKLNISLGENRRKDI
jgi:hypothetical protein